MLKCGESECAKCEESECAKCEESECAKCQVRKWVYTPAHNL